MQTKEEFLQRISDLELEFEELERSFSVLIALTFCLLSILIWHSYLLGVVIGITTGVVYWKFMTKKPFTSGMDRQEVGSDER